MKSLKSLLPWQVKFAAKYVLVRIPGLRTYLHKLHIFSFGKMTNPDYAIGVFRQHYDRVKEELSEGYSVLELGPGDSVATAIIARHHGAAESSLVDVGDYASRDVDIYNNLEVALAPDHSQPKPYSSFDEMLRITCARYLTRGLQSLKQIQSDSIDFIFSHAVLEHVALDEFRETIQETFRLQSSGGYCSHAVDLRDHLADSLNSLRYSPNRWHAMMSKAGYYTNRLRSSQIVDIFESAGYEIVAVHTRSWDKLPIPKEQLHKDFQHFTNDELKIWGVTVIGRKP